MRSNEPAQGSSSAKGISRIESFSDSIFGFAITLLVLELLQIPRSEIGQDVAVAFSNNWQHFFAFMVGFCTILICWINHHHLFCHVVRYDGVYLWINGALLLIVTFIPLPTAMFSEFLVGENSIGLIMFGLAYFLVSITAYGLWTYAYRHEFLDNQVDGLYYKSICRIFWYGLLYTLAAFVLCFVASTIAMTMYLFLFGVFAFPHYFTLRYSRRLSATSLSNKN